MKYLFILNPGSRGGKSSKQFKKITNFLDSKSVYYDSKITSFLDDAYKYSLDGNKAGYDVIVAVGGDGTLNRVLNGFYDTYGKRISDAKMGVVYTGTSPDFCKSYNIPVNVDKALQLLLEDRGRKIQVGKIIFSKEFRSEFDNLPVLDDTAFQTRYFACCANIGLGATLARYANSGIRKVIGDYAGTFVALIKTLVKYKPSYFKIHRDGIEETIGNVHSISIGKTTFIASGIKIINHLREGDGHFYNLIVKDMKIRNWLSVFKKVYTGRIDKNDNIVSLDYCKEIDIYGNSINPEVEFDGDPAGFLPCKIKMAEDKLDLICEVPDE